MTNMRCAREEELIPTVAACGLEEMRITRVGESTYVLSVKLKTPRHRIYLSTRRNPAAPRHFKHIEAAAAAGRRLFKARYFTLVLH